ncbi:uncharacterized protein ACLA_034770 [Aspergillus clavatus NRRL 1]|uniref:Uncharacterized protein n=1 Tax=Aspergillus clavatus (strain ATCC 1007 / CBS 513.65 / DSM 816 / NCTC 3887 / NRRL 1 / QM 1276 / 107) TaxID=344612 RepID=A1CJF0_ASPCL|nr:uncharacterized protein ACLA_034770 [Aspergillus clavatus NRRL 1]EAW09274.1 hypothetical protein ACLA_034770 [Aspergillus clavatus NRRL 1]
MKLINEMAEKPYSETIFPLYRVMTGLQTVPGAMLEIPSETMSSLQVELTKTLRNLDDHMGNLLCLATFARIASSWTADAENKHGPYLPSWLQSVKGFFGQKRGLKTLDLVVLRVILACSASCNNLSADKAAESIRLAIDVCDSVEQDQKDGWIANNSPKIAKLCEKVTREGIDHQVQMMGVAFLVSLLPATALSSKIPKLALQTLLSNEEHLQEVVPLYLVPRLVKANSVILGKTVILEFANCILSKLRENWPDDRANTRAIQRAKSMLQGLQALDPQFFNTAVTDFGPKGSYSQSLAELIGGFPRRTRSSICQNAELCYASLAEAENELLFDLLVFTSHMTLSVATDADNSDLTGVNAFTHYLSKAKSLLAESRCDFSETKPLDHRIKLSFPGLGEQHPTSRSDWRAGIAETIMNCSRMSHDTLIRKIEEVCVDLERRCNTIEEPLRAVEEERDRIASEAEQLRQHNEKLQSELQQSSSSIAGLERDLHQLQNHAQSASVRVQELTAGLDTARREIEEQRHTSQETSISEREKARTRELDLLATITEKDDQIEELQEESQDLRDDNDKLRQTLDMLSKENGATLEQTAVLKQEASRLQESVEQGRLLLGQKDEEIKRLLSDQERMSSDSQVLQRKLDAEIALTEELRGAFQTAEELHKTEVTTLRKQYESQLSEITMQHTKNKEETESLQAAMRAAASNAAKKLQTRDQRIQHLERKVQQLRDERATKAREFSEAQQHIGRLMSVMGFKPDSKEQNTASKQQCSASTPRPTQMTTMQQQTPQRQDYTESQSENMLADSFASATPQPSRRSPKRSRNAVADQDTKELACRSRVRPRRERPALADANQNSQSGSQRSSASLCTQEMAGQDTQYGGNLDENHLHEIDLDMDLDFSKDFLFTSTSLSGANDNILPPGAQQ